jgi:hypothetical protein
MNRIALKFDSNIAACCDQNEYNHYASCSDQITVVHKLQHTLTMELVNSELSHGHRTFLSENKTSPFSSFILAPLFGPPPAGASLVSGYIFL